MEENFTFRCVNISDPDLFSYISDFLILVKKHIIKNSQEKL